MFAVGGEIAAQRRILIFAILVSIAHLHERYCASVLTRVSIAFEYRSSQQTSGVGRGLCKRLRIEAGTNHIQRKGSSIPYPFEIQTVIRTQGFERMEMGVAQVHFG